MNKQLSLSVLAGVVATSAIAVSQPAAHAASFSFSAQDAAGCVGLDSCTVNGFFSLEASTTRNSATPIITQKSIGTGANTIFGLGIDSDDPKDGETGRNESIGEIDVDEILGITFKKAGVLSALDLSFLYRNPTYGDEVFEVALVTADDGITKGTLSVTGTTSATWSLGGLVQNLSPSVIGSGGAYRIFNPFGDLKIKGFSLTAVPQLAKDKDGNLLLRNGNPYTPVGAKNSDFMLSRVEVTKVPEPATLLGLGVIGLAAFARRRNVAKAD